MGTVMATLLLLLMSPRDRRDQRNERGDVPGWVLITVMTAGLVAALWAIAGPQLSSMLRDALSSVRG
jgi:hypothetical protein